MKTRLSMLLLLSLAYTTNIFGQQSIKSLPPTKYAVVLYSDEVTEQKGNNNKIASHWVNKGGGSFTWKMEFAQGGDYEVALNYAAPSAGSAVKILAGNDVISAGLAVTSGYYSSSNTNWSQTNFERREVPGKLHLTKGMNTVTLELSHTPDTELNLYSVELIPAAKKTLIKKDLAMAQKMRSDAKWFTNAGYGLMFHWTSQSTPLQGAIKPYQQAVNDFDIGAFVKMVQKTGACYVIFTTNHAEPYFPAPLKSWEKEYPGHTTKRDLIAELADSLQKHNIKLILYLATHIYAKFDKVNDQEFERLNFSLLGEIGARYQKKVAGYWLDGWYQSYTKHPSFDFESFYKLSKIGNKDRLLCLNSWLYPAATMWQDYFAGEFYKLGIPSATQILENGPGRGLPAQTLVVMESDNWLHTSLNTKIKSPDLKADELLSFISKQKGKGPVTINIQIYQDGSIGDEALKVMETVNKSLNR